MQERQRREEELAAEREQRKEQRRQREEELARDRQMREEQFAEERHQLKKQMALLQQLVMDKTAHTPKEPGESRPSLKLSRLLDARPISSPSNVAWEHTRWTSQGKHAYLHLN